MSAHEGKILEDLSVKLPRPRDRKDKEYIRNKDHLTDILKLALNKQPESPEVQRKLCLA
jgi:ABC-type nitrate/sulfonate/bicarbonate transport system ATPase subunit